MSDCAENVAKVAFNNNIDETAMERFNRIHNALGGKRYEIIGRSRPRPIPPFRCRRHDATPVAR